MQIRVAVQGANPLRRRALRKILVDAGHVVSEAADAADVVLADGDCPSVERKPTIVLGAGDPEAMGLLPANADANQIDAALRAVAAGLIVRSPVSIDAGFGQLQESDVQALLTPRELEVLGVLIEGLTNKAIARRLNISLHTVKFHVESVFRKLVVRTRAEAVAKALDSRHLETIKL
jgi:DNA-binding NarL/FixJ family response regulator